MKMKRILALLISMVMVFSLLPVTAFAAQEPTVTQSSTMENQNQAGGIVYTKTSTAKSDGTVDITLTAHTTGEVRQMTSVSPTDIVLVLDVSGSMDDSYTTTRITGYNTATGVEYTYTTGFLFWQEEHTAYGFEDTNDDYYINTGTVDAPAYTLVTYTGRDANGFEMYEYSVGNTEVVVYPTLTDTVSATREHTGYSVVQFYTAVTESETVNKMTSLQNAVNSFIDTTAQMNEGLETDEMHTISIVKFADDSYYGSTTPTVAEGNHKGAGNNSNYNYSEVVKNLTPVDAEGATALKAAVNALDPGGATAVDYGLNLAEAVLMNRSAVVAEGAVDRNEVVVVFTDGEPNHSNGFDTDVANDAIETAGSMESVAGVTVYGVCIDANADATDTSEEINQFMHYMTSNFPNATSMTSPGEGGSIDNGYYMTPDSSHSLSMIFESIIQDIDHPAITLGEEATIVDTLSPYFDFENGNATDVTLQTSARNSDGTWADPVDDSNLTALITDDRLTVNGFDFDANYVSDTARGENGDFYGKRLVVSFTVTPDYGVIDAASATLMDGVLPTNSGFASLVDSDSAPAAEVATPELSPHNVTYMVGGEEYTAYQRFTGAEVTVDDAPTKEGYTFSGWTLDDEPVDPGDTFAMPDEDVTIEGTFTANEYNVTYQYSGLPPTGAPSLPAASKSEFGTEVTVAVAPVLEGYVFKGWYPLQTDVTVSEGKFTMPAKDVTLVGYFESATNTPYKVEHYLETLTDGVYETTPVLVEDGLTGTTGHTVEATPLNRFEGFEYNATKSADTISGAIKADGKLVLKVYYDRKEYKVTYGYDGDTQINGLPELPDSGTYRYGEEVTVAAKVTPPDGYTFTGWYRGTVDNSVEGTFTMPAYDVHLLGYFTANTGTEYKVEHYLMGTDGEYATTPEVTETFYGTTDHTVEATPLTTFDGFTYNETAPGTVKSGKIEGDGSLVLKLYYDRNKYTVTYEYERTVPAGATALPTEVSYYHGAKVDIAADATAAGYTFSGWHIHDETIIVENNSSFEMPKRAVTVYGYFTANTDTQYTVEHYLQNIDDNGYTKNDTLTQTLTGVTGETATATALILAGFEYNDAESTSTKSGTIAGDGSLVLKLYYDRQSYNVTYKYEGDVPANAPALPTTATYRYGATVTVAGKATPPEGYDSFFGWYRGAALSGNIVTSFEMPARDVELLGYFVPSAATEYKVEHYLMNEQGTDYVKDENRTETLQGTTGHTVTALPLTTVLGEGFTYNESKSTDEGEIEADGSLVLKLYYDRNKYKVTYEYERPAPAGAQDVPTEVSYYHGAEVTIADDYSLEGYTFVSWHHHATEGAITVNDRKFDMPSRDVKLYGYFVANTDTQYTVEHYLQNIDDDGYTVDNTLTQTLTGVTGETATATALILDGFTYNDEESAATKTGTVAGDGSLVLKLYYDRNKHNVTYEYEGEIPANAPNAPTDSTEYTYGADVRVEGRVTAPAGYTFVGWYSGEVTNIITSFTMPDRDVILRGYFRPGENTPYTIHHYLQKVDGSGYEDTPALVEDSFSGTTGHTVTATPLNRFEGFTYNEEAPDTVKSGAILGDGSLVLKLYYDRKEYEVTYGYEGDLTDIDEPTPPAGGAYLYGAPVTVEDKVTAPTGYTFIGWYRGTADSPVSGTFDMPNFNVHLLGNFAKNTNTPYRVEHYLQKTDGSGYELDSGETRHGTTDAEVSALPKEYTGFKYNEPDSTPSGKIKGDGTLVLKFYYDRNKNNVTYVYEGMAPAGAPAAPTGEENVLYGTEVTVENIPSVPGYTFNGWTTEDATIAGGKFNMPDKDVVLKGSFAANIVDYTVNFYLQNVEGDDYTLLEDEEGTGYTYKEEAYVGQLVQSRNQTFTGFSLNQGKSNWQGTVTVAENGVGNLVLNLYFDRHTYNVTYGYYGEQPATAPQLPQAATYRYGATVTVADKPTLSGYTFDGWYTHTATVGDNKFTMPDHDVTLLGLFEKNTSPGGGGGGVKTYTLTYVTNGGTQIAKETYVSGKVVELNKVPRKEGYVFDGWHLDEALTEDVEEVKMTKNITVYAAWVEDNGTAGDGHPVPDALNGKDHFAYVIGYPDGTVRPGANITRAEVTSIFFRLLTDALRSGNLTEANGFADVNDGDWYNTAISTMAKLGIVTGRKANEFAPDAYITRAEFAAICARFDDAEFEVVDSFSDVNGHWAEDEIHEAAAHGWIRGYEDGTFRPDRYITRAEAMTLINRVLNRVPETASDLLDGMIKWPDNADVTAWYYLPVQEATNSHEYELKNHVYEKWTKLTTVTDWTTYEK